MNDIELIKNEINKRKISRICHLTQSRKLCYILGDLDGIHSVKYLNEHHPDILDQNDKLRLDNLTDHINCSIEFPNPWYFNSVRARQRIFKDWVILLIDPSVLYFPNVKFAYRNAAALAGKLKVGFTGLQNIYDPEIIGSGGRKIVRSTKKNPACPTDGQAEVLIPDHIPKSLITGILVKNEDQALLEIGRLMELKINYSKFKWIFSEQSFSTEWVNITNIGKYPKENIIDLDRIESKE